MGLFCRRPLFLWCSAFTVASAGGFFLFGIGHVSAAVFWGLTAGTLLAGLILGGLLWYRHRRRQAVTAVLAALSLIAGLASSHATFAGDEAAYIQSQEQQVVYVKGLVIDRPYAGSFHSVLTLELHGINGRVFDGLASLSCDGPAAAEIGDIIELPARVIPLEEAAGTGYSGYAMRGDGYVLGLRAEAAIQVVDRAPDHWRIRLGEMRRTMAASLQAMTGPDAQGLPSALLLGEKSYLSDEVRRDFGRAGVSHLLAISGLHMTLLFGLLEGILRAFRLSRRVRALLLGTAAVGYLFLLGFPPSATRAVIMLGFVYLSILLSARADSVTSLGMAGVLILAFTPYAAADAGFWMSYLATLGLVAFMPWINACAARATAKATARPLLAHLRAQAIKLGIGLIVGILAMTFTLSVVAAVIGEMGILSPIATLMLTPLCGAVLLISLIALPFASGSAGPFFGRILSCLCSLMSDLAEWMGAPRRVVVSLRHPAILPLAGIMTASLLILLAVRLGKRRRWVLLLPLLIGWTAIGGVLAVEDLTIDHIPSVSFLQPSSQADMLVLVEGRDAVICDFSNGSLSSLRAAAFEASERGATEIGVLCLTHYHGQTAGAISELFGRETVRALWLPTPADAAESELAQACAQAAKKADVPVSLYAPGEEMRIFEQCVMRVHTTRIARSAQPVLLLELDTDPAPGRGEELIFCGSAVFESALSEAATHAIATADAVIFGNHGPVVKERFGGALTYSENVRIVLSEKGDIAAHFNPSDIPEKAELWMGSWHFEWS